MIIVVQALVFFRESLIAALDRIFRPYLKHFALTFNRNNNVIDDEDSEDHVYAEFDDEKGVVFCPPVYAQRYAAVSDCLMDERWCGMLEKVVDFGYHDMSFLKYLKDVPGIKHILGVDIESIPLRCSSDLLGCDEYVPNRESPLHVSLFQGNAADPDYRLIGCDAVIAIEMIEHMYPQDLERLVHTIFGFIKPWIAVITTPNGDFNTLFKSMEKNGFRRLDHFFEWSREQFHDWCSNIVLRYPHYTVSCRGVGPGPPGTVQYGCCSQLALFVSKDYHKQQDLNLNSLVLVAKKPSNNTYDVQAVDIPDNEMYSLSTNNIESYKELMFSNKQSCVTIVLSPVFSYETVEYPEYRDKMSQCNLDKEIGKNFLMFNEEDICEVVVPRRPKPNNRVYVIEDVNTRLNCTTLQVKKFSKKTQHLMAKNRIDSLVHAKEVVDDIRHLTKMLNFDNESREQANGDFIWHNINWGDNAPYWNQYYQIVREYTYPVEMKSEESRILDLISDEINRFVDLQFDEGFAVDMNKVEIPLDHLMRVVHHITDDVDKVKDLLEWNGYEISDGVVIYSRLVLETTSVNSHDDGWRDSDISDWDTEVHSTSLSNGSTIGADFHGRNLHRALDQKVRKLRSMMSNNEDIGVELDRVVSRLMKLALRTATRRQRSLSYRWMQCKLLDLLNLSEKAIEKKRQMFAEVNQIKAICYDDNQIIPEVDIAKIKSDETANEIVNKYQYLLLSPDKSNRSVDGQFYDKMEDEFVNDFLKDSASMEFSFRDIIRSPAQVNIEPINSIYPHIQYLNPKETPLSRTKTWIDEDVNVVVYSQNSDQGISSGDTDHSACNIARYKHHKNSKKRKKLAEGMDLDVKHHKRTQSRTSHGKRNKDRKNDNNPQSKGKTSKTILKKRSSYNMIIKTSSKQISAVNIRQFGHYFLKAKKSLKRHAHETGSRPISKTLIELCSPENEQKDYLSVQESTSNSIVSPNIDYSIAATKESLHIGIVTENNEETIALRRTIGTDPEDETTLIEFEPDYIHGSMTNIMNLDSFCNKADCGFENTHSQTLFLYDINEPSTSKGVRHVSLDVQCGPETNHKYAILSTNTSHAKMPAFFNTGLKIENSCSDVRGNTTNCDFGTCTNDNFDSFKTISQRERFTGITIKDSVSKITEKNESGTMTQAYDQANEMPPVPKNSAISSPETTMLKPISSYLKVGDSGSELCDSICSSQRSALHFMKYANYARELQTKLTDRTDIGEEHKFTRKYTRPKLTNGGVYVHSYKERQVSEDVVYQGKWQKHIPVPKQKKKSCNVVSNKTPEANKIIKANFKENVSANIIVKPKTVKVLPPKNTNLKEVKKGQYTDQIKKTSTLNVANIKNCYRNTKKVTSKFTVRPVVIKKSPHIFKKPSQTSTAVKKDSELAPKLRKKSYIPLYLKRKLSKNKLHKLQAENALKEPVAGSNKTDLKVTEDINKSLMNVEFPPRENLSFVVFQNEVVNNKPNVNCSTDGERLIDTEDFIDNIADNCNTRSLSLHSLNSSADSTNTVATVRVRPTTKLSDKRHSNSSNKSNSGISQMENTPVKTKKVTRCKSARRYQDKVSDNKENLPETSKKNNLNNSSTFTKNKNVFRAQIATDNLPSKSNNTINKRKSTNKSNIKIPSIPSSIGKQSISGTSCKPSVSKQRSIKSRASLSPDDKSMNDSIASDPVATPTTSQASDKGKNNVIINIIDNNQLTEWLDNIQINVVESKTSILNAMRELVEERLDLIEKMLDDNAEIDFRTTLMSEKCDSIPVSDTASFYDATSLNSSYGTVMGFNDLDYVQIMDFDSTVMGFNELDHSQTMDLDRTVMGFNDLDNSQTMDLDRTVMGYNDLDHAQTMDFDRTVMGYNDLDHAQTMDFDRTVMGFNDLDHAQTMDLDRTVMGYNDLDHAQISEYYLAESSMDNAHDPPNLNVPTHNSVRDIFERKPHFTLQSPAGPLAAQVFSGFSMNAAPVTGDQPDPVNLVDSETGSGACVFARQATSEEVFVSGRSSESYESCLIDEETVVPNWLFQIISRQRSVEEEDEDEEEESDDLASNQMPLAEPVYDMNGNTVEPGMGASAGAGDGRGIHSDHSQDSSGHGTSLSSTASSSPNSEAILIDPTAFTTQMDLTREPGSSSVLVPLLPMRMEAADTSHAIVAGPRNTRNPVLNSSGDPQIDPIQATSDVDADISSTDTDVLDSSDN